MMTVRSLGLSGFVIMLFVAGCETGGCTRRPNESEIQERQQEWTKVLVADASRTAKLFLEQLEIKPLAIRCDPSSIRWESHMPEQPYSSYLACQYNDSRVIGGIQLIYCGNVTCKLPDQYGWNDR